MKKLELKLVINADMKKLINKRMYNPTRFSNEDKERLRSLSLEYEKLHR